MKQKGQENKKYSDLITIDNLFQEWSEFRKGKKKRKDIQIFERHFEDNLFGLQNALQTKKYRHGDYQEFYVHDPKRRHIHKASVQDRIMHHLLYTFLYSLFNKTFIFDSYSCRLEKGTHKGVLRLEKFTRIISKNYTRDCWVLKCDIKKFFASIDQEILLEQLKKKIKDPDIIWLLFQVGVDFLGYVILPHYRLARTKTRKRIFKKLELKKGDPNFNQSLQSYLGYFSHANSYKLTQKLKNQVWFWKGENLDFS